MSHRALTRSILLALLATSFDGQALAQEFLLTAQRGNSHFVARIDTQGKILAHTTPGPLSLGAARFYRQNRWVAPAFGGTAQVFDDFGTPVQSIPLPPVGGSLDALTDGRIVIRDSWQSFLVSVVRPTGAVTDQWGFSLCAGGPNFGMRAGPNNEVWLSEDCGGGISRYDDAGNFIAGFVPPIGVGGLFDESCDEFAPAPDGTVWILAGSPVSSVSNYAWDGTQLSSFSTGVFAGGIAIADDGSVWVRDDVGSALLHFDAQGTPLGATPLPTSWAVWSFDIRG